MGNYELYIDGKIHGVGPLNHVKELVEDYLDRPSIREGVDIQIKPR